LFNRRAANSGFKPEAEPIAPADEETVEFAPFPSVLGVEHCAHNFKAFAGLQTFTTPLAAVTLRVYPNRD
jgi:hypothetical protein